MAIVNYKQRNRDNMQALIDNLRQAGAKNYPMAYLQAGLEVLLGEHHDPKDVQMVKDMAAKIREPVYSGKFYVYTDKTKKLFQPTTHQLIVWIIPNDTQQRRRGELENAIEEATKGTSVEGWPVSSWEWQQ